MTKEEFAKRWGYQTGIGYGQALFDCREQLLKDLEEVIKNLSLNLPVVSSGKVVCPDCGDFGWIDTDDNGGRKVCPCHY